MRNKLYSDRRRKLHTFFNRVLKNSFIAKLIHKNQVSEDINIDPLTGIYSQFAINTYLNELHPQSESNFGIILMNIDNLDSIKESFSLKTAHKALASIAQALLGNIRETDLVGRYSDSEFILILSDVNKDQATHIAARLTQLINNAPLMIGGEKVPLQSSCGVSVSVHNTTGNTVLEQADQDLYFAKTHRDQFFAGSGVIS